MFGCQQVLLKPDQELGSGLKYICSESNKLHDFVYSAHQMHFEAQIYLRHFDLNHELKRNPHYGNSETQ
jgi:putative transposase